MAGTLIIVKSAGDDITTEFSITVGGGLSPATITLVGGDSYTYEGVPAGSGYSVEETLPAGWAQTSIAISNASPADNITIDDDETVTVIVTNAPEVPPSNLSMPLWELNAFMFKCRREDTR
jgi:hypothetical protein